MDIQNAPRSTITIQGIQFSVPAPFVEGHTLRSNEAEVLNQTYAENIRNNFAAKVKLALSDEAELDPNALQIQLNAYIETYDFGIRRGSGGGAVRDPVATEARKMAADAVRNALKKKGLTVKEVGKDKLKELVDGVYTKNAEVLLARAREILKLKSSVGEDLVGE